MQALHDKAALATGRRYLALTPSEAGDVADATAQAGELLTELFPGLAVAGDSRLWLLIGILWKLGWVYVPRLVLLRADAQQAPAPVPARPAGQAPAPSPPPMPSIAPAAPQPAPVRPEHRSNGPGAGDPANRQTNPAELNGGQVVQIVRAPDLVARPTIPPGLPRIDPSEMGL